MQSAQRLYAYPAKTEGNYLLPWKYLAYFNYGLHFGFVSVSFLFAIQNTDTYKSFPVYNLAILEFSAFFMLRFKTTQRTRIACTYSLLPPPTRVTLNGAQLHRSFTLAPETRQISAKLTWIFGSAMKPKAQAFSLGFSFHRDNSMQLESFEKCQAPNEKELELLVEVSWAGRRGKKVKFGITQSLCWQTN